MAKKPMSNSDIQGFAGILLAIIALVYPMTWWLKIILLIIFAGNLIYFIDRSKWTINWCGLRKFILSFIAIIMLIAISWTPVKNQYYLDRPQNQFSISMLNAFYNYPFAYKDDNEVVYYIDYFLYIDLVNQAKTVSMIRDYTAQVLFDDEWINLQMILFAKQGQFYVINDTQNKIGKRIEFFTKTFEEQIKNRNLSPGETVRGILMFYLKDRQKSVGKKRKKLKLIIFDSHNNKEEHIINLTSINDRKEESSGIGWVSALGYKVKETNIDMKQFKIINNY
jgi:hypothetical protein